MEDSEDADTSEYEETQILFMGLNTQASNNDSNVEGEVDLRVNLLVLLKNLRNVEKRTNSQTMSLVSWKLNF